MTLDRRQIMGLGAVGAGLGLGTMLASQAAQAAGKRRHTSKTGVATSWGIDAGSLGIHPGSGRGINKRLQNAINEAAASGHPLLLGPGIYDITELSLPAGSHLIGVPDATILRFAGGRFMLRAVNAASVCLDGLTLDGALRPMDTDAADGLINAYTCSNLRLNNLTIRNSLVHGISLRKSSGSITDCTVSHVHQTGVFSIDADGLEISHNAITDCDNNGIQVWKSVKGEDGTIVTANRIARIKTVSGGTGQNGNGINIYRAGSVLASLNRITDCAYSALRGNAASNMQLNGNSIAHIGEVALYAEFGFEGALIANNLVDGAATGIAATNFNDGGRLAVIQGNIVRNLNRREYEPQDKRGNGIGVEADAVVTGNVIEDAATTGIMIGWGEFMRDVTATSNLIRNVPLGIGVTAHPKAGTCYVGQNMISNTTIGAIRAMDHARAIGGELAHMNSGAASTTLAKTNIRLMGNIAT